MIGPYYGAYVLHKVRLNTRPVTTYSSNTIVPSDHLLQHSRLYVAWPIVITPEKQYML